MFDHPAIETKHRPILERAMMNNASKNDHQTITELYVTAKKLLIGEQVRPADSMLCSVIKTSTGPFTIVSITDSLTGIYVQVSGMPTEPQHLLTLGRKWAIEAANDQGQIATRMW